MCEILEAMRSFDTRQEANRHTQESVEEEEEEEEVRPGMADIRVFMVNKEKGWQEACLLERNVTCSHLSVFCFLPLSVQRKSHPRHGRILHVKCA